MQRMNIFLDTEFTDFVRPDLISIALVGEDGGQTMNRDNIEHSLCKLADHLELAPLNICGVLYHAGQRFIQADVRKRPPTAWLGAYGDATDRPLYRFRT